MQSTKHPLALVILDGFGIRKETEGNAVAQATKPNLENFFKNFPRATLSHSGVAIGLPMGVIGGSEVGHKSIGSGRISSQTLTNIQKAIMYGSFYDNPALYSSINNAIQNNSDLHIVGLLSDGGCHSYIEHLFAIFRFLIRHNFKRNVYFHFYTDGRDVGQKSVTKYLENVLNTVAYSGLNAKISSIGGRFWGMDRIGNWARIERHYNAFIGKCENQIAENEILNYINESYKKNITDEFIEPVIIVDENKKPIGNIKDNDSIIFFNFRADRMREMLHAFVDDDFEYFSRQKINNLQITTLAEYETDTKEKKVEVAFKEDYLDNTLAETLSKAGLTQLHIAETEKYAHITYFLNGGNEVPFSGEDRIIIPSKKVKSYEEVPEMSAVEVADKVVECLREKKYDFYAINFANSDILGHSGNLEATIKSIETVDMQVGRIYQELEKQNGFLIITGDHGNCEQMIDPITHEKDTEHNVSPVPFILVSPELKKKENSNILIEDLAKNPIGTLADIMPTILDLYGIPMPEIIKYPEMKGSSLLGRLK